MYNLIKKYDKSNRLIYRADKSLGISIFYKYGEEIAYEVMIWPSATESKSDFLSHTEYKLQNDGKLGQKLKVLSVGKSRALLVKFDGQGRQSYNKEIRFKKNKFTEKNTIYIGENGSKFTLENYNGEQTLFFSIPKEKTEEFIKLTQHGK